MLCRGLQSGDNKYPLPHGAMQSEEEQHGHIVLLYHSSRKIDKQTHMITYHCELGVSKSICYIATYASMRPAWLNLPRRVNVSSKE